MLVLTKKRVAINLVLSEGTMKELYATSSSRVDRSPKLEAKPKSKGQETARLHCHSFFRDFFHSNLSSDDGKARLLEGLVKPTCLRAWFCPSRSYPTRVRPDMVVACSR